MRAWSRCAIALMAALCSVPIFAAADVITVQSSVTFPTANPGGADEGCCLVSNNTQGDVRTRLDVSVIYSDGTVQRLSGIGDPGVLGPGDAFQVCIFFVIPPDASVGTAQFVCSATGQQRNLRETEVSISTFGVVP